MENHCKIHGNKSDKEAKIRALQKAQMEELIRTKDLYKNIQERVREAQNINQMEIEQLKNYLREIENLSLTTLYFNQATSYKEHHLDLINWWYEGTGLFYHPTVPKSISVYKDFQGKVFIIPVLNEADFFLGDVALTFERLNFVEFSFITLADSGAFVTHAPGKLNEALALLRPFHWQVWPAIGVTFIIVGPVLYAIIALPNTWQPRYRVTSQAKLFFECTWYTITILLKQNSGKEPSSSHKARFLIILLSICATYVLIDMYSANLTSLLARPGRGPSNFHLSEKLNTAYSAIAFQLGCPYIEEVNKIIAKITEDNEKLKPISLKMLQGSFYLLCFGIAVSGIVLAFEIFVYTKYKRCRKIARKKLGRVHRATKKIKWKFRSFVSHVHRQYREWIQDAYVGTLEYLE
ncbi:unnamed protein product [Brassicogethes aeneus]|uniref:Ionotropic glutamate receptor C-terminal domain-containing protein n=1 Tax=Brassicogethes aeneus TaxID=1431903 RepID=A0A9P0FEK0_BRAAE|nr:unnamed protein product [Brassicogethes aeneus]